MPTYEEQFNSKMNALANSINTKAGSTGAKTISQLKMAVDSIVTSEVCQITTSVTNGTYTGATGTYPDRTGTTIVAEVTIIADSGCVLPTAISVVGASYTYDNTSGKVTLTNATSDITITAVCVAQYSITANVTNGSATGDSTILDGGTASVTIVPTSSSILPDTISVTGAAYTYNNTTGVIVLSNPTGDVTIVAECVVVVTAIHCVVSGLGSQTPSNVTFTKDSDFTKAGLGIEEVTYGGDTFIKIPTMYRKVNSTENAQITSFTISTAAEDSDFHPYSVFVDESGNTLDYVLFGKYWNSNSSSMVSTQETNPVTMTVGSARTNARARGTGYLLYDWQFQKLWQDLIICLKGTIDTNSGTAWTYDELGIFWGTNGCWVDGVSGNSGAWIFSDKPSAYIDQPTASLSGYKTASYAEPTSNSQEIAKLGYDSNNEFFNYPSHVLSNSNYNSYYCDGFYYQSASRPVVSNVGYATANNGAFDCSARIDWSYTCSVRLCYRPL